MQASPPDDVDRDRLEELTLSDLISLSDSEGRDTVEAVLGDCLAVAAEYLAELDVELSHVPVPVYEPHESGVGYDPYHDRGEALIVGGPRGILRGGEEVLGERGLLSQKSLLSILAKGLVHSYNHELVTEHFERYSSRATRGASIELYDRFRMLVPAVDEGFAQFLTLYRHGDVTDRELREEYIDRWAEWYARTDVDEALFVATASSVGERIEAASGSARDRFVDGLEIQEPLIRDGDVSIVADKL